MQKLKNKNLFREDGSSTFAVITEHKVDSQCLGDDWEQDT